MKYNKKKIKAFLKNLLSDSKKIFFPSNKNSENYAKKPHFISILLCCEISHLIFREKKFRTGFSASAKMQKFRHMYPQPTNCKFNPFMTLQDHNFITRFPKSPLLGSRQSILDLGRLGRVIHLQVTSTIK